MQQPNAPGNVVPGVLPRPARPSLHVPAPVVHQLRRLLNERLALQDQRVALADTFDELERFGHRAGNRGPVNRPTPSGHGGRALEAVVQRVRQLDVELDTCQSAGLAARS